jgi:hypothetical protein
MPRKPMRQKGRIGFTNGEPERIPADAGPEVPGHYEEFTDDGELREERKHNVHHHPFIRPPHLR